MPPSLSRIVCVAWLSLLTSPAVVAFNELTPVQTLIYETPHLASTAAGDEIRYRYQGSDDSGEPVSDEVIVSITGVAKEDRRDVSIDFLSGARHVNMPDFPGYRGNPVIIAMLEQVARSLGEKTGGGTLYFRNRIRDALAQERNTVDSVEFAVETGTGMASEKDHEAGTGKGADSASRGELRKVDAKRVEFSPFKGDSYLSTFPAIESSRFRLVFSKEVPGEVVAIEAASMLDGENAFSYVLRFSPPK